MKFSILSGLSLPEKEKENLIKQEFKNITANPVHNTKVTANETQTL